MDLAIRLAVNVVAFGTTWVFCSTFPDALFAQNAYDLAVCAACFGWTFGALYLSPDDDYTVQDAAMDDVPTSHCPECDHQFRGFDFGRAGGEYFLVLDACPSCKTRVEWDGAGVRAK